MEQECYSVLMVFNPEWTKQIKIKEVPNKIKEFPNKIKEMTDKDMTIKKVK